MHTEVDTRLIWKLQRSDCDDGRPPSEKEGAGGNSHPGEQLHHQLGHGTHPESDLETSPQDTTPSTAMKNHGQTSTSHSFQSC